MSFLFGKYGFIGAADFSRCQVNEMLQSVACEHLFCLPISCWDIWVTVGLPEGRLGIMFFLSQQQKPPRSLPPSTCTSQKLKRTFRGHRQPWPHCRTWDTPPRMVRGRVLSAFGTSQPSVTERVLWGRKGIHLLSFSSSTSKFFPRRSDCRHGLWPGVEACASWNRATANRAVPRHRRASWQGPHVTTANPQNSLRTAGLAVLTDAGGPFIGSAWLRGTTLGVGAGPDI